MRAQKYELRSESFFDTHLHGMRTLVARVVDEYSATGRQLLGEYWSATTRRVLVADYSAGDYESSLILYVCVIQNCVT